MKAQHKTELDNATETLRKQLKEETDALKKEKEETVNSLNTKHSAEKTKL